MSVAERRPWDKSADHRHLPTGESQPCVGSTCWIDASERAERRRMQWLKPPQPLCACATAACNRRSSLATGSSSGLFRSRHDGPSRRSGAGRKQPGGAGQSRLTCPSSPPHRGPARPGEPKGRPRSGCLPAARMRPRSRDRRVIKQARAGARFSGHRRRDQSPFRGDRGPGRKTGRLMLGRGSARRST